MPTRQRLSRSASQQAPVVGSSLTNPWSCLVHASTSNLSPWNRVSVYLSLCAVSNHIQRFKRPAYIAHRDFTPIDCLPDDCLSKRSPVDLPWKGGMPASALVTSTEALAKEAA